MRRPKPSLKAKNLLEFMSNQNIDFKINGHQPSIDVSSWFWTNLGLQMNF